MKRRGFLASLAALVAAPKLVAKLPETAAAQPVIAEIPKLTTRTHFTTGQANILYLIKSDATTDKVQWHEIP